jgi:hypothetical protein
MLRRREGHLNESIAETVGMHSVESLLAPETTMQPISAYAQLNARIMPLDRGERYEEPLAEALAENGFAAITGGGTMQSKEGEIEYCGIHPDLFDVPKGVPFICDFLAQRGAPRGSKLQY